MLPTLPRAARGAAAALLLATAAGCGWFQSALQVHVTVDPLVRATCVRVDLFTSSDMSGEPLERRLLKRPSGKDDFIVAVYKGDLPSQVFVSARPMFGVECDNLVPNGAPVVASGTFPPSGFTPVDLPLLAPGPADDGDGDGFVPAPGGADCNDGDPAVNPGASEHCTEAADFNCNALIGCADPVCPATSCLASPTRLGFASAPQTLAAGACSAAVQVDTLGSGGAVVPVVVPASVSFSALDGNLRVYSDPACTVQVSAVPIAAGRSRATVYLSGTTAGAARLGADASGLTSAQQAETVTPGAAASLVFTTAPQTMVPLGGCSEPVRVELRDAFGNATPVGTPLSINLASNASSSSTFKFYPDAACQNAAIVQTTVASGGTSSTFYFKSTASAEGTVIITAAVGTSLSATQSVGLVFRQVSRLVFPNPPVTVAQSVCSPAVALQTQDSMGNPAPVFVNVTIGLSSSSPSVVFYRDAACATTQVTSVTLTAGLSSVLFYFKGNQGMPTLTANGGLLGSPQQTETVTAPQPTQLAFATAPQTVGANACSGTVNVDARDGTGAAIPVQSATPVALATNPSGQLLLYAGAGCMNSPITSITMGAGTSRVTISFKGTLAAATDVTASATGLTSATQTETVTPAAGTKVLIAAGKNQSVPAGTCASLTLERQDPYGNATTGALETMNLSSAPASGVAFYGSSGCTSAPITTLQLPAASARIFLYFKGTAAGSYTLTEAPQSALTGDTAPEIVTGGAAAELRFTSTAQSQVAAGNCSAAVTVATFDGAGNPANVSSATAVNLGATGSTGAAFYSDAACATQVTSVTIPNNSGSATSYFRGTIAGSGTLTASASGLTSATPQSFTIVAGAPARLAIIQGPVTTTAGLCSGSGSPIQVQVQDVYGNPSNVAAATTVNLAASNGTAATMTLSFNQNCNGGGLSSFTIGAGSSTSPTIYFKTTATGTWTITASAAGLASGTQDETVTPDNPAQLAYLTGPQAVAANGCSAQVTVQIQDQYGNPSPPAADQNISLQGSAGFFKNSACTNAINTGVLVVLAGQTNGSFFFKAPAMTGSYTITVSGVGSPVNQVENIN